MDNSQETNPQPIDGLQLSLMASLSRQYAADQRSFLGMLAQMIELSFPDEAEVVRKGGLFSPKVVKKISVTMEGDRYSLEDTGRGPLHAARTHIVRGIALKTEEIPIDEWIQELSRGLEARASANAAARDALARLLE